MPAPTAEPTAVPAPVAVPPLQPGEWGSGQSIRKIRVYDIPNEHEGHEVINADPGVDVRVLYRAGQWYQIGTGVADGLWLCLLGRKHERVGRRKPETTRSQKRRQNVIKRGWDMLHDARKRQGTFTIPLPPAPRVLNYIRRFPGFRLPCDASLVGLW